MNDMRTASRDLTEFLSGVLTVCLGLTRGKLERCLFVHESNEARVVSHVDDPLTFAKPLTLDRFWIHIAKLVLTKKGEALNPRILVESLGFECCSFQGGRMTGSCSLKGCKTCCDAVDGNRRVPIYTTEQPRSTKFMTHCLEPLLKNAVHYFCDTRFSARDRNSRRQHLQI